jgi:hypothetical protein
MTSTIRKNTLQTQLQGFALNQQYLNTVSEFLANPYDQSASPALYANAIAVLASFNSNVQSIVLPINALSTLIATLPDGTVWYYSVKTNNTYASFLTGTIAENHNTRSSFQQAIKNGFGFEIKPSSSVRLAQEQRVVMRLGISEEYIGGCIGLAVVL